MARAVPDSFRRLLALSLAMALILLALNVPTVAADEEPAIFGQVTDAQTGDPLVGAEVYAFVVHPPPSPIGPPTETDQDGRFAFYPQDLSGHDRIDFLIVEAEDYEGRDYPAEAQRPLYDGSAPVEVDIALQPMVGEPSIVGTVTDAQSGEPVPDENYVAIVYDDEPGWASATGAVDGAFEFWTVDTDRPFRIESGADRYVAAESDLLTYDGETQIVVDLELEPLGPLDELDGATRYETAVTASQWAWEDGADAVIITTGANWPDALTAAGLSSTAAAGGPVLLTPPSGLPEVVTDEIERLGAETAYVVGGTAVLPEAVVTDLDDHVDEVERLGGETRYETSTLVADKIAELAGGTIPGGFAWVVTGANYPDAMAASPLAAVYGSPILLVADDEVPAFDGFTSATILGGTQVVTSDTEAQLAADLGEEQVRRLAGETRYGTAAALAADYLEGNPQQWDGVGIATGADFPDGIAGGAAIGHLGSVLLLTGPDRLHADTEALLTEHAEWISHAKVLGGLQAIGQDVRDRIVELIE